MAAMMSRALAFSPLAIGTDGPDADGVRSERPGWRASDGFGGSGGGRVRPRAGCRRDGLVWEGSQTGSAGCRDAFSRATYDGG